MSVHWGGPGAGHVSRWSVATTGVPVLSLDFLTSNTLDPRVTFTRSTTATFVGSNGLIQTAAINAPRFDYNPVTLAPLGLLIEEQRVNLLLYSEQFDNAGWSKSGSTITANTTVSPDGTTNADSLVEDGGISGHRIAQTYTGVSTSTYTTTFFAKLSGRSWARVLIDDNGGSGADAFFDLSSGVVGTVSALGVGSLVSASITPAGNGWYRCSLTCKPSAVSTGSVRSYISGSTGNTVGTYLGTNGLTSLFLYGAQLEAGAFATSYIFTVASTVTRAVDVALMTGTNFSSWYNQSEGTIIAQFVATTTGVNSTGGNAFPFVYEIDSSAASNSSHQLVLSAGYGPGWRASTSILGVDQAALGAAMPLGNASVRKIAYAYQTNNFAASANGGTVSTDTSGTLPSPDRIGIGCQNSDGGNPLTGYIRTLTYYSSRLTNAQLQALTT
jgi:hypothetical protein